MRRRLLILSSLILTLLVCIIAVAPPVMAMEQVIIGGYPDNLSRTTTEYNSVQGGYIWQNADTLRIQVVPTNGAFSHLSVELSAAPAESGRYFTITLCVNGNPSALAVTITGDSETTGIDTDSVDVVAGDYISLRSTYSPTAPSNTPTARWSIKFTGTTANESIILGRGPGVTTAARYAKLSTGMASGSGFEYPQYQVIPTEGIAKKLYVILNVDPGDDPDDYYLRLRVNGADSDDGEGNPLSVTIVADNKTGNDTTHSIPLSAGNLVSMAIVPENSPASNIDAGWGLVFVATVDGESLILGGTSDTPTNSQTEYTYLNTTRDNDAWGVTENFQGGQAPTNDMVLKKFYVHQAGASGDGKTWTYTIRGGGGSTDLVVAISGASATTGSNTVDTYTCIAYDDLAVMAVPTSSPTAQIVEWGTVCYISTGLESPQTYPPSGETGNWTNPTYAYSSDNSYATRDPLVVDTNSPTANTGASWNNPTGAYADAGGSANITSGNPSGSNVWDDYGFSFNGTVTQVRVRYDAWTAGSSTTDNESIAPTDNVTWTNLDGSYADVDDDPDSPDANWADTIDNELDTLAHVSFPSPSGNLTTGAGLQNFKIWVKRSTAFAIPQVYVDLYEGGVYKAHTSLTATNVTSDSGQLFTCTWDAVSLANADGSGVEAYIYGDSIGVIDWVTPNGETLNGWTGAGLAWDDDTGTASSYDVLKGGAEWSPWLELTTSALPYDQVRIWSARESVNIVNMQVDVYYDGGYVNIYNDVYTGDGVYATFPIGSTQTVSAMRVRYQNDHKTQDRWAYVHEADFYLNALASVDVGAIEWNAVYDTSVTYDEQIKIDATWDNGSSWTSVNTDNLTSSETTYWFDITGETAWTAEKLNDTNFQVRAYAQTVGDASTVYLDWLPVEVTYYETSNLDHTFTDYDIELTGYTITKLELGVEGYAESSENLSATVTWNAGGDWATSQVTQLAAADSDNVTWFDFTSATSWDASSCNNTNFQAKITYVDTGSHGEAYVDWLPVRVTFTSAVADIANSPSSKDFLTVSENTTYYAYGSAPSNPVQDGECTFTVTNNSGANVDITIEADNFTGGVGWALTSGAPGENTVKMIAYYSGQDPASGVTLTTSPQAFISGLADNTSELWDFSLQTGSFTDGSEKTSTITLSAALS